MLNSLLHFEIVNDNTGGFFHKGNNVRVLQISSRLLSHVTRQYYGKRVRLYMWSQGIKGGIPQSLYLTTKRDEALDFSGYEDKYILLLIPTWIADSYTPLVPEVARVSRFENAGYGIRIFLPLLKAPKDRLIAWYAQPNQWTLYLPYATAFTEEEQARRVLNGKEPLVGVQTQLRI